MGCSLEGSIEAKSPAVQPEQVFRAEKMAAMGIMAGGLAHGFNNLLMVILGNTQLLLREVPEGRMRKQLQKVEGAVQEAAQILRRLQAFSSHAQEHRDSVRPLDVNKIVQDIVELTRPRWKNALEKEGHTIGLRMELDPHCQAVIHASDLREILTNLILNAVDAMPSGGTLTLKSSCGGKDVFIEVVDTGVGINSEDQQRIFDPFFTTKGQGNSGLGLSVSWNLVHQYRGDLQVFSEPGKGSLFRIRLPGIRSVPKASPVSQSTSTPRPFRILLIDDDPDVLKLLSELIRLSGHKVLAVQDGEEALGLIDAEEFDLVLTDLGMPLVSGWQVAKRVKVRHPLIPVVLITGWGAQVEEEDLCREGIDLMLSKPVSYEKLQEAFHQLL